MVRRYNNDKLKISLELDDQVVVLKDKEGETIYSRVVPKKVFTHFKLWNEDVVSGRQVTIQQIGGWKDVTPEDIDLMVEYGLFMVSPEYPAERFRYLDAETRRYIKVNDPLRGRDSFTEWENEFFAKLSVKNLLELTCLSVHYNPVETDEECNNLLMQNACCWRLADLIKGKTADEIRATFD